MTRYPLRDWQRRALSLWEKEGNKGIVSVVTGGGKTIFALSCVERYQAITALIIVPTTALLEQWWEETAAYFKIPLDDVHIVSTRSGIKYGAINISVINTASRIDIQSDTRKFLLIVDECHKAASAQFSRVLDIPNNATLGLSATPERPYDDGLNALLIPKLGPVLIEYTYKEAIRDKVIVPFKLQNIIFDLEDDTQNEYDKVSRAIARSIEQLGPEAPETVSLMLKRARIMNLSLSRVRLTLKIISRHRDNRVLVFHEDIEACNLIHRALNEYGVPAGVYHSGLKVRERAQMLAAYRGGAIKILVTCRALDEGFNVPETEIGIVAASTATRRQRIQRMGRILRPSSGKSRAIIYTLVATGPEIARLKDEEAELQGVASIEWGRA